MGGPSVNIAPSNRDLCISSSTWTEVHTSRKRNIANPINRIDNKYSAFLSNVVDFISDITEASWWFVLAGGQAWTRFGSRKTQSQKIAWKCRRIYHHRWVGWIWGWGAIVSSSVNFCTLNYSISKDDVLKNLTNSSLSLYIGKFVELMFSTSPDLSRYSNFNFRFSISVPR